MLFLLSPAKTLDYESSAMTEKYSIPGFLDYSEELVNILRGMSANDISALMGVSENIASLNVERYKDWTQPFTLQNAKQAIYAFKGDVYTGLAIESADDTVIAYVQNHIRILSGLYGLLLPLDLIQAYRLEMGTKLESQKGKNLYEFWGDIITDRLNQELDALNDPVLVNLASNEYFKSVRPKKLNARIVTPIFKDLKNDKYKIVSFYAKKARGLMARFAADNQLLDVEGLKKFDYEGYRFNEALSKDDDWVFTRDKAPK